MTAWTAEDIRVASLLEAQLGPIRVIEVIEHKHKENRMTDTVAPDVEAEGWEPEDGAAFGGATYPEYPYSLADHVYTWSPKLPDGSMLVIRASTAEALAEAAEAVAPLAGRLRAAWQIAVGQPAAQAAATGPSAGQYQAGAGAGANYNPQMPPPNQPYPGQPAWQQARSLPAPAPQWSGAPQQQGERKQYPAPQGWYKLNVPFPGGTEQLHAVAQQANIPKGQPAKGGMYNFWGLAPSGQPGKAWYCAPQVVQAFGQFNPMVG